MARPVNAAALAIAETKEGCFLRAYRDPKGIWTIGLGHTGPDVTPGKVITQEEADSLFAKDMAKAGAFVETVVKVPLTDNQFSALAEFVFNVGTGHFAGSTLLRLLNRKQYDAVPGQLLRWINPGSKFENGLRARRQREVALWNASEWTPHEEIVASNTVPPTYAIPAPSPPSLIERVRSWFHRTVSPKLPA